MVARNGCRDTMSADTDTVRDTLSWIHTHPDLSMAFQRQGEAALDAIEARVRVLEAALDDIERFVVARHIEGDTNYQPALIARAALAVKVEG